MRGLAVAGFLGSGKVSKNMWVVRGLSLCVCVSVCVLGVRDQEARKLEFWDWDLIFLGLFVCAVFSGKDACNNIPMHQCHQ